LARIPVDIMKAIVSVPAQILSARINYDNQATAQINAQVELLKAQLEALQAQRALDAAKVNQTTGLAPWLDRGHTATACLPSLDWVMLPKYDLAFDPGQGEDARQCCSLNG
jgi:hypothetical protein